MNWGIGRVLACLVAFVMVAAACEPASYIYDDAGRLRGVSDPDGDTAVYTYDAVGNITGIASYGSDELSIVEFAPRRGDVGDEVVITGTGFGDQPAASTVEIDGTPASVTAGSAQELRVIVPAGATTGPITVTTATGTATSAADFTVAPSQLPRITGLSTWVAGVGETLTVDGSNFETDPLANAVMLNDTRYASVAAARPDGLDVVVPPRAASGPLSVATPAGTAVTEDLLFVPPERFAGTDVGFTGRTEIGDPATVSIETPGKIALLVFEGQAGQRVNFEFTDITFERNCGPLQVSLVDPTGAEKSVDNCPIYEGPFRLTETGLHTIVVAPREPEAGQLTLTIHDVPPDVTGEMTIDGAPFTADIVIIGQAAELSFEGEAGRRISLGMSDDTFARADRMVVQLVGPDGRVLASRSLFSAFIGPLVLPDDGTYRIRLFRSANEFPDGVVGEVTFRLFEVPPDVVGEIEPGGPAVDVAITTPTQTADLTFPGSAGDRISVSISDSTFPNATVYVRAPDGTDLAFTSVSENVTDTLLDTVTLPAAGTYHLAVRTWFGEVGSLRLKIHVVPPDAGGPLTVGAPPEPVSIDVPGQNAEFTFAGTAGHSATVLVDDPVLDPEDSIWTASIVAPDGTQLDSGTIQEALHVPALPADGTYRIRLDPWSDSTGSATVRVLSEPPAPPSDIEPGGDPVTVTIDTPGQTKSLRFNGTAGQRVNLDFSEWSLDTYRVRVVAPDGSTVTEVVGPALSGPISLPSTGRYQLVFYPATGLSTGSATLRLHDVPPDITGELSLDGQPIHATTAAPGQDAALTFSGTAGQRVSLVIEGFLGLAVVRAPDGSQILYRATRNPVETWMLDLPADGTYQVELDYSDLWYDGTWYPQSSTFRLYAIPDVVTAPIVPDGAAYDLQITAPGTTTELTFAGSQGQEISLLVADSTIPEYSALVRVVQPDGTTLPSRWLRGVAVHQVLAQTGTYRIRISQYQGAPPAAGSATLRLSYVPPPTGGPIVPDGPPVDIEISVAAQAAEVTFDGTAGQRVTLLASDNTIPDLSAHLHVFRPDGSQWFESWFSNFRGPMTLPATGSYRVRIQQAPDTGLVALGSAQLRLYDVPPDATGTITPGGAPVTATIDIPGHATELTFTGTAGRAVSLAMSASTFPDGSAQVRILKPDGTFLASGFPNGTIGPVTLPAAGAYRIRVEQWWDTNDVALGSVTLTLSNLTAAAAAPSDTDDEAPVEPEPPEPPEVVTTEEIPEPPEAVDHGLRALHHLSELNHPEMERTAGSPLVATADAPAAPVTRLSGTVKRLDGTGLPGVTVDIQGQLATTGADGAFVLEVPGLTSGRHELVVDGSTANAADATYGTFAIGVDLVEGSDVALDHTVWMPALDTAHTVDLQYPLTEDVVVTTPAIPGLEVRIPAGSEVRDRSGDLVTEVGITEIPADKPPFPLPEGVAPRRYFTIQPGGATVNPGGFTVVQPNAGGDPAGAWFSLYDYDTTRGWYAAGTGEVDQTGNQIVPHDGVSFSRFTGVATDQVSFLAPPEGPSAGADAHPVDLATGLFVHSSTDLTVPDVMPISLSRTYRPEDDAVRAFGRGSGLSFDLRIWTIWPMQEADLVLPNGVQLRYVRTSPGQGTAGAVFEHTDTPTEFYGSRITPSGSGWKLELRNGTTFVFGMNSPVLAMRDANGNELTFERADVDGMFPGGTNRGRGPIVGISTPSGRWVELTYDDEDRIIRAQDHVGRVVSYTYDAQSRLHTVTDPAGGVTTYGYDPQGRIATITSPSGATALTNSYDADGRIASQTAANGATVGFAYETDADERVTRTEVTDARGVVRAVDFEDGYWVRDTAAVGTELEQAVSVERHPTNRLILASVDQRGRRTEFTYDGHGNQTTVTTLADTPDAVTTRSTYEPRFHKVATETDALGRTVTYDYDDNGNVITETGPDGVTIHTAYDELGRIVSTTDALGNTTEFDYEHLHRVTITDAFGLVTQQFVDSAGRDVALVDPTGAQSRSTYDVLDRVSASIEPNGARTSFEYDADGNVRTVVDANGHPTTYTYNEVGRVRTVTDALGATDHYEHDPSGNVIEHTDRRGVVTTWEYDDLGNTTEVAYGVTDTGTESTVTSIYDDLGLLLEEMDDSAYGRLQFDYDDHDRLVAETSSGGTVTYDYDDAGQLTATSVEDGPSTTYDYDDAGRLRSQTQGDLLVTAHRNDVGQVTALDLPNGVTGSYEYNQRGAVTKLTYSAGDETLGDVAYGYDGFGRRSTVNGGLVSTPAPAPLTSASYDDANRLTSLNGTSYEYDAAGNLLSDGTNTFTWNARGQLSAVDGPVDATFTYDPSGRRTGKTVDGSATSYLYAGSSIVQEQRAGGSPTTYFEGLGADEVFARTTGSDVSTYLLDGLGSTVGLADADGQVATKYAYDAFGGTTPSGADDPNPFAYTGRELDETGLYFYRSRYYQPEAGRFITEDPLGFGGGSPNFYSYVGNNPVSRTDPSGMCWGSLLMALIGPGGHMERWWGPRWHPWGINADMEEGRILFSEGQWYKMDQAGASPQEIYDAAMSDLASTVASACGMGLVGKLGLGSFAVAGAARVAGTQATKAAVSGAASAPRTTFIGFVNGPPAIVPRGAVGPVPPNQGQGISFRGGAGGHGLSPRVDGINIMDAYSHHQQRLYYFNTSGQKVNPWTGQTIGKNDPWAHMPW